MALGKHLDCWFKCAMKEQLGSPHEKMRLAGLKLRCALIFLNSLKRPALALRGIPKADMSIRGAFRSTGTARRLRRFLVIQSRRVFRQSFFGAQDGVGAVTAEIGRVSDAGNVEVRFFRKFQGRQSVLCGRGRLTLR